MARPHSQGLEYFEHDVDASNDEKIESMEAIYGASGYAFYFKMAERIYRAGGMLIVSDAEIRQILARKCLCTVEEWAKMLATALKLGLFDAKIYENNGSLTSNGIQKRCQKVFDKRQKMADKYKNRVSAAETYPETPPVEESRVEESRVEKKIKKVATLPTQKHSFDKSPYYPFEVFRSSLPNWTDQKCREYFERAEGYSRANGGKYLDWRQAAMNWDRKDSKTENFFGRGSRQTESAPQPEFRFPQEDFH